MRMIYDGLDFDARARTAHRVRRSQRRRQIHAAETSRRTNSVPVGEAQTRLRHRGRLFLPQHRAGDVHARPQRLLRKRSRHAPHVQSEIIASAPCSAVSFSKATPRSRKSRSSAAEKRADWAWPNFCSIRPISYCSWTNPPPHLDIAMRRAFDRSAENVRKARSASSAMTFISSSRSPIT